jgi:hypothetical protein
MNFPITNIRYLRIAQLSLLIYYVYLVFQDSLIKGIPLLLISGLLDYVYPPSYARQSFWNPYKIKTIFLKNNNLVAERILEFTVILSLGFLLSCIF